MRMRWIIVAGAWACLAISSRAATAEQTEFFESRIRPILAQECYECHSEQGKQKGGLLLDSRPGWMRGGDSGDVIKPGDPAGSLLLQSIRHDVEDLEMPKAGAKLDDHVIADFEKWIGEGAPDPRDTAPTAEEIASDTDWNAVLKRRKEWWSFQPVSEQGSEKSIDDYLGEELAQRGIPPAPPADALTLLRRTTYVLTGLPPSAEQMAAVNTDESSIEGVVDGLLASPAYGEKWARHFMDWVRYAESYGSEGDPAIPYAYQYRDYLIRAFNDDVPYPQMVREAIAGDLLPNPRIKHGINESAIGIGQLRMVLHGFSPVDALDEMVTFTDNQIDTVTKAFQALTVSCARCHNHKFDAISQADFYALYGIFTSTHPAVIDANAPGTGDGIRAKMTALKKQIKDGLAGEWLKTVDGTNTGDPSDPSDPCHMNWEGLPRTAAGEFAVSLEGDTIIKRIYPAGYVSDLISPKDRGVVFTNRFENPGGTLWFRLAGNGGVKAKYVVQNYPRTGTIHKAIELKDDKSEAFGWRSLDLEFWKGDEIFLQVTTAADMPAEFKDQRSWFALDDALITQDKASPPEVKVSLASPRFLITAWKNGTLTSAGAEALNRMLQSGTLRNQGLAKLKPLVDRYRELEAALPEPTRVPGVIEADPKDAALFVQGDHKQPAELVPRRFLDALDPTPFETTGSGRLQLAQHMADMTTNPFTARVMVNRLWHHVFGRGIVATVDNFGKLGEQPTHPELLDFLAQRFIDSGGSIKGMLKMMIMSKAFQRSADASAIAAEKDPENKLLSHWSLRRLEAEAIRDSILHLSGKLDRKLYGESVSGGDSRRSVYVKVVRNALDPFLTTFDAPVPFSTRGKRDATNVPAQSLTLLNDARVIGWSQDWAARVLKDVSGEEISDEIRAGQMFREAFGREPGAEELRQSVAYLQDLREESRSQARLVETKEARMAELNNAIEGLLGPARARLQKERKLPVIPEDVPEPFAEWTFDEDLKDSKGRLPLELIGGARIENGALRVDGTSMAKSGTLPKPLKAKTLEAWVMLDDLEQRGGGVITVQGTDGGLFDSIVFAEKAAGHWVAGSNRFERSEVFDGLPETEADSRPVHVAVVYQGDGTVSGYRDGKPYGRTYRKAPRADFDAERSQILLGCRHGSPNGNRGLSGRIFRARVYDRALTQQEIAKTARIEASTITEADVLATLSDSQRARLQSLEGERSSLSRELQSLRPSSVGGDPQLQAWANLAQSLINLKEFIYLR